LGHKRLVIFHRTKYNEGSVFIKSNVRACITYIAGRLITGKSSSSVYDFGQAKYINFGGSLDLQRVNVYDYDQGCHISGYFSGKVNGNSISFYDYGESTYFSI